MVWLVILLTLFVYIFISRMRRIYKYWDLKEVPGPKPVFLIGNMIENILGKKSFGELCMEWSKEFDYKPLLGLYNFTIPFLMVQSVDCVETVMIKEFSHFMDRAPPPPSNVNLSDKFLFIATGKTWKALRNKLAPVFTTGKLRSMTGQMSDCFTKTLRFKIVNHSKRSLNIDDFIQYYIIDVTAKIVFGIESDDFTNPSSEFWKRSQEMFTFNLKRFISFVLYFIYPRIAGILKIPFVPTEQTEYFQKIVEDAMRERSESGCKRNDIIQLLLELKNKGYVDVDTWEEGDDYLKMSESIRTTETVEMTDELISSQAMVFLTTGFDTMSTVLTFTLTELALNERIKQKLYTETENVILKHGDFTYEALRDMKYLDMCLMESMRIHPPIPSFLRYCTKSYIFDNGTCVDKGTMLVIPVLSIHMDPHVYSNPEEFVPERFTSPPRPGSYLPFGDGPRTCIAKRFAMLEMKMMLARFIYSYDFTINPKTKLPIETEKWNFLSKPTTPVYFDISKRLDNSV